MKYEILSLNSMSESLDGEEVLIKEILKSFLNRAPKLLLTIEKSIKNNNYVELESASHILKGVISNFSEDVAVEVAHTLENFGNAKIIGESEIKFLELKKLMQILSKEIEHYMGEK